MERHNRTGAGTVLLVLVAACPPASVAAQEPPPSAAVVEVSRVRSPSAKLRTLIADASDTSRTFRDMIAKIESTDGIVLIEEGRCPRGVRACLTWQVTIAGPYRLLFVRVNSRRPDLDLAASIAHELQHAIEVLSDPSLRTTTAIQLFYTRGMSPESPRAFETAAATAAGHVVWREMRAGR